MASPANMPFRSVAVDCPRCRTEQSVHVVRVESAQVGDQEIVCARCNENFTVTVPARIIGGPFLSQAKETTVLRHRLPPS
jgi:transposase-like protein